MQQDLVQMYDPRWQWSQLHAQLTPGDHEPLLAAFEFAARIHHNQWRKTASGKPPVPYMVHPVRVARILLEEWGLRDRKIIATALLHDVLEDCHVSQRDETARQVIQIVGQEVFEAVDALTKSPLPPDVPEDTKNRREANYFRVIRGAEAWVRLVKCADRVDNLRDARSWGQVDFWVKYKSETIGWHLYLARETAPIAEVALFKALVDGERALNGRVPIWADGNMIDPNAAEMVPEHIALCYNVIGLAKQGKRLIVGVGDLNFVPEITLALHSSLHPIDEVLPVKISQEAVDDALKAGMFGRI